MYVNVRQQSYTSECKSAYVALHCQRQMLPPPREQFYFSAGIVTVPFPAQVRYTDSVCLPSKEFSVLIYGLTLVLLL